MPFWDKLCALPQMKTFYIFSLLDTCTVPVRSTKGLLEALIFQYYMVAALWQLLPIHPCKRPCSAPLCSCNCLVFCLVCDLQRMGRQFGCFYLLCLGSRILSSPLCSWLTDARRLSTKSTQSSCLHFQDAIHAQINGVDTNVKTKSVLCSKAWVTHKYTFQQYVLEPDNKCHVRKLASIPK